MSLFFFNKRLEQDDSNDSGENVNSGNSGENSNSGNSGNSGENASNQNAPKKVSAKSSKKQSAQHTKILLKDFIAWMQQRVFALTITCVFIIINCIHWLTITLMHVYTYGTNATLSQLFMKHHPGKGPSFFFGHANVTNLLIKLCHSLLFVNSMPSLIVNSVLAIVLLGLAETRISRIRIFIISIFTTVIGMIVGLAIIGNLSIIIRNMHWITRIPIRLSPFTLFIGAFMASAAYESILWHRRMLVIGYAITSAMMLYSGNPGDYCTIIAALTGHILGNIMCKSKASRSINWWEGTDYEIHRLFAVAQCILALGPLLALSSRSHAGILTTLGLFMSPQMGSKPWLTRCIANYSSNSCLLHSGLHHAAIGGVWIRILLPIVTMMIIAWGMLRGRRLAAWTSMVINAITVLYAGMYFTVLPLIATKQHIHIHQHNAVAVAFMLTALPPLLMTILLAINLKHFSITTKRLHVQIGLVAIFATLWITAVEYVTFGLMIADNFKPIADIHHLLRDLPGRWMPMGFGNRSNAMLRTETPLSSALAQSVGVIFWAVLFIVCLAWFRSNLSTSEKDREKASSLVELGGNTMSFMTTWPDNHYWFSPTGNSAIAYRLSYGVALTLTGPFGDSKEYSQDIRNFIQMCEKNSWTPAFYAVHDSVCKDLKKLGFTSIKVGTDMLVDPNAWQTRGKKWQDIRTAINKAKRDGITDVLTTYNEAPWDIQQQIVEISEEWAELKALPEMKFTLGGLDELRDNRVKILYAIDEQGRVLGVTSWMPTYSNNRVIGWTLDFMRHRTDSPNGIMELLIARMAERLQEEGLKNPDSKVEFMSLSAAPLAGIDENSTEDDASKNTNVITHALEMMSDILEPAYGFKSLYFFKKKFQPTANPVYVCYLDSAKLAQISLAVTHAYLPEASAKQILEMVKSLRPKTGELNK